MHILASQMVSALKINPRKQPSDWAIWNHLNIFWGGDTEPQLKTEKNMAFTFTQNGFSLTDQVETPLEMLQNASADANKMKRSVGSENTKSLGTRNTGFWTLFATFSDSNSSPEIVDNMTMSGESDRLLHRPSQIVLNHLLFELLQAIYPPMRIVRILLNCSRQLIFGLFPFLFPFPFCLLFHIF